MKREREVLLNLLSCGIEMLLSAQGLVSSGKRSSGLRVVTAKVRLPGSHRTSGHCPDLCYRNPTGLDCICLCERTHTAIPNCNSSLL